MISEPWSSSTGLKLLLISPCSPSKSATTNVRQAAIRLVCTNFPATLRDARPFDVLVKTKQGSNAKPSGQDCCIWIIGVVPPAPYNIGLKWSLSNCGLLGEVVCMQHLLRGFFQLVGNLRDQWGDLLFSFQNIPGCLFQLGVLRKTCINELPSLGVGSRPIDFAGLRIPPRASSSCFSFSVGPSPGPSYDGSGQGTGLDLDPWPSPPSPTSP